MKKPKEQQQSTSSTFVVAPTDEVAHSSCHSAHPIMDKTQYSEIPNKITRT